MTDPISQRKAPLLTANPPLNFSKNCHLSIVQLRIENNELKTWENPKAFAKISGTKEKGSHAIFASRLSDFSQ